MSLLRRAWNVFRRAKLDREIDDELEFHREMRLRRERERGLTGENADREVSRRMGNLSIAREEMRDARVIGWLASSLQDLRHGVVLIRRDGRISLMVALVLALGIGGNAAIFTLLKAAYLDPLPFRDAGRLIALYDSFRFAGADRLVPTIPEFLDVQARSGTLEQTAFLDHRDYQITGSDEPARVFAARASASFFPLLGATATLGRTFTAEENRPGRTNVVVISDGFWRTRMGADPNVVGKTLRLNGDPSEVIGVLPPGFSFDYPNLGVPEPVDIYVPFEMSDYYMLRSGAHSNVRRVIALGRLRPGSSLELANAELRSIAAALIREHPGLYLGLQGVSTGFSMRAEPLRAAIVGNERSLLTILLASVGVLFLIACANAAQLLLARSLQRRREVAIRAALGATRGRLVRQFLLEGMALAVCGGVAGLIASHWITRLLIRLLPSPSPVLEGARPDLPVLLFTFALSVASATLFALIPAVKGSRWAPGAALTTRSRAGEGNGWRRLMMASEAALSVVLLSGAAIVAQNLWKLVSTPVGFDARQVWTMRIRLPFRREQAVRPIASLAYQEYLRKISAIPGVDSAAMVTGLPILGAGQRGFRIEGDPEDAASQLRQSALVQIVSPDYFRTLRIPLLAGRPFRDDDIVGRMQVAVVNQEFVRRFGNGRDLIGRRIGPGSPSTIVGVVADVRMRALDTAPQPQIYVSYLQAYEPNIYLVVRSSLGAGELMSRVKEAIRSSYADQAVFRVMTMDEVFFQSMAQPRFYAGLLGAFALLALAMAGSGMYSVISCLVSQRSGEIAIRMALGAGRRAIVGAVLGATLAWAGGGLLAGVAIGLATGKMVRTLSNSTAPASPTITLAVVLFFLLTAAIAAYLPVRRAMQVDPATALRSE